MVFPNCVNFSRKTLYILIFFSISVCLVNAQAYSADKTALLKRVSLYKRPFDGSHNAKPGDTRLADIGAINKAYARDQVQTVNGSRSLPNSRHISNVLATTGLNGAVPSDASVNEFRNYFAQFIVMDILKTEKFDFQPGDEIRVPTCDKWFDPYCTSKESIPIANFSDFALPINLQTSWLDLSVIYGTNDVDIEKFRDPHTGRLKFLYSKAWEDHVIPRDDTWLVVGDSRVNEHPGVHSFAILFMKNHNFLVDEFHVKTGSPDPNLAFQYARRKNIAHYQKIVSRDYVSAATGSPLPTYTGYNPTADPSTDVFVAACTFRYGHSAVTDIFARMSVTGKNLPEGHLKVIRDMWNPSGWNITSCPFASTKASTTTIPGNSTKCTYRVSAVEVLVGMSNYVAGNIDVGYVDEIRQFNFGLLRGGNDLLAIDIERGRQLNFPDYNTCRERLNISRVSTFAEITSDEKVQKVLQELYGSVDNIDPIVGILAEDHVANLALGPLTVASLREDFARKRDADYFWYENTVLFTEEEIREIQQTRFKDLIRRNFGENDPTNALADVFPDSEFFAPGRQISSVGASISFSIPNASLPAVELSSAYRIQWELQKNLSFPNESFITYIIDAKTNGWIGIGWSSDKDTMKNGDIVICTQSGECIDYYALDVGIPTSDTSLGGTDDVFNVSTKMENGIFTARFSRKLITEDKWDKEIGQDNQKVMWAFNPSVSTLVYHGPTRGTHFVNHTNQTNDITELSLLPYPQYVYGIIGILLFIGICASMLCCVTFCVKIEYFAHLTKTFCLLIFIGSFFGYISAFIGLFPLNSSNCMAQIATLTISYIFSFPTIFIKIFRVWMSAEKIKIVPVKERKLFSIIFVVFGFEMTFIAIWALVATPNPTTVLIDGQLYPTCFSSDSVQTKFWGAFLVFKLILLCLFVFLSIATKPYTNAHQMTVGLPMYIIFGISIVFSIVGFSYPDNPIVTMSLSTLGILIPNIVLIVILFFPIKYRLFFSKSVDVVKVN